MDLKYAIRLALAGRSVRINGLQVGHQQADGNIEKRIAKSSVRQ